MAKPYGNGTFIKSLVCATRGAFLPFGERNMQIHIGAAFIAITVGLLLKIDSMQWCLIIIVISHVITKEIQNSAYEDLADACHPDCHPKIRNGKDKFAGAVLGAAFEAVAVGLIIFGPKIMAL